MLTVTVLAMLHLAPQLNDGAPRHVRLVADEVPQRDYAHMTRAEQKAIYDELSAKRPGIALPMVLIMTGGLGAVISAIAFWIPFSTVYGVAVYAGAIMITAFAVSLVMVGLGVALIAVRRPERAEIGAELDVIEQHYNSGRCLSVPGERPCRNDPRGPQPQQPQQPREAPRFVPQVSAPGPVPSLVVATF
jgi:hypothetical protein